ncbi:MAG: DMT family transporter [Actinobacteria bacterium]|nr:DMT family transporter [Actinomycetota bacterium]
MQRRSWPIAVGLSALWGLSFLFLRGLVDGFGWPLASLLVCLCVGAGVGVVARLKNGRWSAGGPPGQLLVLAVSIAVQNGGLCLALDQLGVSVAAIVLGATPLFATVIGQAWGIDRITGRAAIGLVVGFVGLVLVVVFPLQGDSWASISGMFAGLVGALAAAFTMRYSALHLGSRPAASSTANLLAAVLTVPAVLLVGAPGHGSYGPYLTLLLLGLIAAAVGPLFGVRANDGRPAGESMVKTAGMVLAVLIGLVALGERLSAAQGLGLLLMVAGTVLVLELVPAWVLARLRR